jgi:hypothetical protein
MPAQRIAVLGDEPDIVDAAVVQDRNRGNAIAFSGANDGVFALDTVRELDVVEAMRDEPRLEDDFPVEAADDPLLDRCGPPVSASSGAMVSVMFFLLVW